MTKGELVSNILGTLNFNTKDTRVSRRLILSVAETYAVTYMAQRLDSIKLEDDYSLTTVVKCFPMEQIDYITCGLIDLKNCNLIYRSKEIIPKTVDGSTGKAIYMVTTINGQKLFKETTRKKYLARKNRRFTRKDEFFFFVEGGYLYIPDTDIELVNIHMIALDEEEAEEKSECSECKDTDKSAKCKSLWEEKFICPEKLLVNVVQATRQEIATKVQIPLDENPDMDSNQKTRKVQ